MVKNKRRKTMNKLTLMLLVSLAAVSGLSAASLKTYGTYKDLGCGKGILGGNNFYCSIDGNLVRFADNCQKPTDKIKVMEKKGGGYFLSGC